MEFVAPLMLLGVLGIGIPIAMHLIGRRRAKQVRFAAVDFLLGSDRKLARRLRVRELLLLLARILVCLAVPLVLAKPYTSCEQHGPLVERGPQAAVIVIDDSVAGRYKVDGTPLIDSARQRAKTILTRVGPEAEVAVLLSASKDGGGSELSRDHVGMQDKIAGVTATWRPADTSGALRRAQQLLEGAEQEKKTIFLVSALARTGFSGDQAAVENATLRIVDIAEDESLDNVAVTGLEIESDPDAGSRGIRVTARIANFSHLPVQDRGVTLEIAGRQVSRATVSLGAGETVAKRFAASMPRTSRSAELVVALDGDSLAADDRRHAIAELRDQTNVLLVNGDPRTVRHDDELFYLDTALRPGDRSDSGFIVAKVTADELPKMDLSDYDAVVLANVRALDEKYVAPLVTWVRAGGGLLIACGDNVVADAYNDRMLPLLPQRLQTQLDTVYGKTGSERKARAQRLTKIDVDHPVFAAFGDDATGLGDAAFSKVVLLGPTTNIADRRVLARYQSGAVALVEGQLGSGRVMLYTSTLDRDWTELPIHPGFLPLSQQIVRYLAKKQTDGAPRRVLVGETTYVPVGDGDARIELLQPDDRRIVIEGDRLADHKRVRVDETDLPGIYRVSATVQDGKKRRLTEADFAVNIDPRASDLRRAEILPASLGAVDETEQTTQRRRVELWHALAAALLLFLLFESALALRS